MQRLQEFSLQVWQFIHIYYTWKSIYSKFYEYPCFLPNRWALRVKQFTPVNLSSPTVVQNDSDISIQIHGFEWLLWHIIDLINPIHWLMLDSARCLHVTTKGEESPMSGALIDCNTSGMKQLQICGNEINSERHLCCQSTALCGSGDRVWNIVCILFCSLKYVFYFTGHVGLGWLWNHVLDAMINYAFLYPLDLGIEWVMPPSIMSIAHSSDSKLINFQSNMCQWQAVTLCFLCCCLWLCSSQLYVIVPLHYFPTYFWAEHKCGR